MRSTLNIVLNHPFLKILFIAKPGKAAFCHQFKYSTIALLLFIKSLKRSHKKQNISPVIEQPDSQLLPAPYILVQKVHLNSMILD
jgi:hypothetical protein